MGKIELMFLIIFLLGNVEKSVSLSSDDDEAVKIGGLFVKDDENAKVFEFAVEYVNAREEKFKLEAVVKEVTFGNEFESSQNVCNLIEENVVGIIGPTSPESAVHVRSICDMKEIPLIETLIDGSSKHVINLHPTPEELGKAYLDLIEHWDWQGFTIVYENAPWLPLVDYILNNYHQDYAITVRELDAGNTGDYRHRLRDVKQSGDSNIVICSSTEQLPTILTHAQQVGLMTDVHRFIITSLDMHTVDMEAFKYCGANITGFRLVSPDDRDVKVKTKFLEDEYEKYLESVKEENVNANEAENANEEKPAAAEDDEEIKLSTALVFDAVDLYSRALKIHSGVRAESVSCDNKNPVLTNGFSIFNAMKVVQFKGMSGHIQFDQHGNRENVQLEILELATNGLQKVGVWNNSAGIQPTRVIPVDLGDTNPDSLRNKTLLILTVLVPPYGMLKDSLLPLQGNDQYEGFAIELIEKLSLRLGFNYTFKLQADGAYGNLKNKETNEWDGMIGELMADRADFAICDLTITSERESAVDFTMPFMTLGISILFEKPKKEDPSLFSFMKPFSSDVWLCLIGCFLLVSLSLFIMGRLSPTEWDNPFPCIEEPEVLVNQFSFKNAMWFSVGALLQQGSEIAPKAPSTRIVASLWWFFTLIMVSSYTANLAAFLTIESTVTLIESVEDLFENPHNIPFGAKKGGSTLSFFRDSSNPNFTKLYDIMMDPNNKVLTGSNDDGRDRARQERYAFFMESSTIEYMVERYCEVVQVGGKLDEKGYGIAMKKNSPFRGALSEAILQMQESGEISRMKTKWWKEKRGGGACSKGADDGSAAKLNMKNVGGVFVVLIGGCALATVQGIISWLINIGRQSRALDIPFSQLFKDEFRLFRQFGTFVKIMPRKEGSSSYDSVPASNRSRSKSNASRHSNGAALRASQKNIAKNTLDEIEF